ncbi:hypothetical protein Fmac_026968 [Flemingia macrophylla]|uniref:Uncharacterized protein n=1 Tax=Flemingia macrophylla TaxID=520843 RepID=A0ABD1LGD7_9FABA
MGISISQEKPPQQHHEGNTKPSESNSTQAPQHNATAVKSSETQCTMPHEYENILKDADSPLNKSLSKEKLLNRLYEGVFLNNKTKKYWVDKSSNNCFILYARALTITWAVDTPQYWTWVQKKEEGSGSMIELAELKNVCWFDVEGKFDAGKLSRGVRYQVSFNVMLKDWADGWDIPINVGLRIGEHKQEHRESLLQLSKESWTDIIVGDFVSSEKHVGEMRIWMYQHSGYWKSGLLVKGIFIKPR